MLKALELLTAARDGPDCGLQLLTKDSLELSLMSGPISWLGIASTAPLFS
jgi:hypothetical protein